MSEDEIGELMVALVRVMRIEKTATAVWQEMQNQFPEYSRQQIQEAVRPLLEKMMQD